MIDEEEQNVYCLKMRKCAKCGKEFYVPSLITWVYRNGAHYYCSWTCYREEKKYRVPGTRNWVKRF